MLVEVVVTDPTGGQWGNWSWGLWAGVGYGSSDGQKMLSQTLVKARMNVAIPSQLLEAEDSGNSTKLLLAVNIYCVVTIWSFCTNPKAEKENSDFSNYLITLSSQWSWFSSQFDFWLFKIFIEYYYYLVFTWKPAALSVMGRAGEGGLLTMAWGRDILQLGFFFLLLFVFIELLS